MLMRDMIEQSEPSELVIVPLWCREQTFVGLLQTVIQQLYPGQPVVFCLVDCSPGLGNISAISRTVYELGLIQPNHSVGSLFASRVDMISFG
jgi:hypothetical protein